MAIIMHRFIHQQMLALCFALTILSAVVPSLFAVINDVTNQETTNLRCLNVTCPTVVCHITVLLEGDCCQRCPYYTPVYNVAPEDLGTVTEGQVNNIVFNMKAYINFAGITVVGTDLWKVSVWASADPKGNDSRIGYKQQVLSPYQSALPIKIIPGSIDFRLTYIKYKLDAKNFTCSEMKYLCVDFGRGDNPKPEKPRLPFTVEGVTSFSDRSAAPENLIGCQMFQACNGESGTVLYDADDAINSIDSSGETLRACNYRGTIVLDGQSLTVDECTICNCHSSTVTCNIRSCRFNSCSDGQEPVKVAGECCGSCTDRCSGALGMNSKYIRDSQLTASSVYSDDYGPQLARLHLNTGGGAWCTTARPENEGGYEFLEISFINITKITAIAIQGRWDYGHGREFVTNFRLEYARDINWTEYRDQNKDEMFDGNNNTYTIKTIYLSPVIIATKIRIVPVVENTTSVCMRVELYGCNWEEEDSSLPETNDLLSENVECLPALCHNAVRLEGDSCLRCPYYAPVYKVSPTILDTVTEGQIHNIVFNMNAKVNFAGTTTIGKDLWKVGVWASADPNGNGRRVGYTNQVLSDEQAAVGYVVRSISLTSIEYELNATEVICSEIKYICVQFGRGDNPKLKEPRLPFTVEGVAGITDRSSAPENLIGCETFTACNGTNETTAHVIDNGGSSSSSDVNLLPCSYRGTVFQDGQYLTIDECTICFCDNSTVVCNVQSCQIISCTDGQEPQIVDGDCCESCPDPETTSEKDLEGCLYRGTNVAIGKPLVVDECTTGYCQANHILRFEIRSCPSIFCDNDIVFNGECCGVCPYYVPVWKVNLSKPPGITAGQINKLMFDLTVEINDQGVEVHGRGLWKVSVWTTPSADGGGKRIGFTEQVLTNDQSDINLDGSIVPFFGPFPFGIRDIKYTLDASDVSCPEMKYLCVQLARGDSPKLPDQRLPFIVESVAGKYDISPAANNLRRCRRIEACAETDEPRNAISFSVAKKTSLSAESESVTISWNHVFDNAGGALNPETGIFTCSVAGSYFFTFLITKSQNMPSPVVQLIKNDELMVAGLDHGVKTQGLTGSADSTGNYIILDLQINDRIWLQLNQGGDIVGSSERFSTFSGFLIFPS